MKRFVFRLDKVLRIKLLKERLATAKVQQVRLAWESASNRVSELQQQLAQSADAAASALGRDGNGAAWVDRWGHAAALGRALDAALTDTARLARALEDCIAARAHAAKEVEVLLTLRRERWKEHRRELLRVQQQTIDEHGLRDWHSNRDAT